MFEKRLSEIRVGALHRKIESVMGVLENTILPLSYLESLNEKYVFFSPLGITSIHSRWIENKKDAECSVEIWKTSSNCTHSEINILN